MKKAVLIFGLAILVLGVALVSVFLISFNGQRIPTSLEEISCTHSVTVQGSSMEPAIKAGTRLLLNKCADRQSIPVGAVVIFNADNVTMVGRVKERLGSQEAVSYRIGQDGAPNREFTVSADKIVASDNW